jgi:hypothetical protein
VKQVAERLRRRHAAAPSRGYFHSHEHVDAVGQSNQPGVSRINGETGDECCGSGDFPRFWRSEMVEKSQNVPREDSLRHERQLAQRESQRIERKDFATSVAEGRQQQ